MIIFVVADKKAYVANNKFYGEGIRGLMAKSDTDDLEINVKPEYHKVIGNYINFMHGKATEIKTVHKLVECFLMNTFFLDTEYFKFLVAQLLLHWSMDISVDISTSTEISTDTKVTSGLSVCLSNIEAINPHLSSEIELYLPFNLVSDSFKVKPSFVREWLGIKDNKRVIINGNQMIETTVQYYIDDSKAIYGTDGELIREQTSESPWIIRLIFTVVGELLPLKMSYFFYPDYKLWEERPYLSGGEFKEYTDNKYNHGTVRTWTSNKGFSVAVQEWKNGLQDGKMYDWYDNDQLYIENHYVNNVMDGHYETYLRDGTIVTSGKHSKGKRVGKWYFYHHENNTYSYHDYGSGHGLIRFQTFDENGLLLEDGKTQPLGLKEGVWYHYDPDTRMPHGFEYTLGVQLFEGPLPVRQDRGRSQSEIQHDLMLMATARRAHS